MLIARGPVSALRARSTRMISIPETLPADHEMEVETLPPPPAVQPTLNPSECTSRLHEKLLGSFLAVF